MDEHKKKLLCVNKYGNQTQQKKKKNGNQRFEVSPYV